MASLAPDNEDDAMTEPIDPRLPKPATHGQVKSSMGQHSMTEGQLRAHLAQHVEHANTTKDYGGHGIGYSSQGGFTGSGMSGGASGAEYETTSVGDTPDSDSAGPTGY